MFSYTSVKLFKKVKDDWYFDRSNIMKLLPPLELKGKSWKKCYKNVCELASWRWACPVGKLIIKGFRNCPTCVSGEEKEWRRYAPTFLLFTCIQLMFFFG